MTSPEAVTGPLWQTSAVEIATGIRRKQFSCSEVMKSVVERIRALNPKLNAIITDLTDQALSEASAADRALKNLAEPGPLFGVPVTIKVNIDVEGQATTNGLAAFANLVAPGDSPLVRNLRQAGAIIVGRTNTPEVSMRVTTVNPLHGRTSNPWHPDASPGGSSGGAGAAAAAGFGPIHHGNDIGGSLRFPAFANGVTTLKPTPGRIPAFNPSVTVERGFLAQLTSVQGAIARTVDDLRLATRVMAAGDPHDPWWVPAPFDGEPLAKPIRVAVTRNSHGYPIHPGISRLIDRTAGYLSDAGYDVVETEPPSIMEPARGWFTVLLTELKATLGPTVEQFGSDEVRRIEPHFTIERWKRTAVYKRPEDAERLFDGIRKAGLPETVGDQRDLRAGGLPRPPGRDRAPSRDGTDLGQAVVRGPPVAHPPGAGCPRVAVTSQTAAAFLQFVGGGEKATYRLWNDATDRASMVVPGRYAVAGCAHAVGPKALVPVPGVERPASGGHTGASRS